MDDYTTYFCINGIPHNVHNTPKCQRENWVEEREKEGKMRYLELIQTFRKQDLKRKQTPACLARVR